MKRSLKRTLSPGFWAAVGGHLEPHEINDRAAAVSPGNLRRDRSA
nr:hypothetical protein [Paenibacillus sophorae]